MRQVLKCHDVTGGPLMRQLRARSHEVDELELSERERGVLDLVVVERRTQRDAAERLGVAPSTIYKDLKAVAARLQDA